MSLRVFRVKLVGGYGRWAAILFFLHNMSRRKRALSAANLGQYSMSKKKKPKTRHVASSSLLHQLSGTSDTSESDKENVS